MGKKHWQWLGGVGLGAYMSGIEPLQGSQGELETEKPQFKGVAGRGEPERNEMKNNGCWAEKTKGTDAP